MPIRSMTSPNNPTRPRKWQSLFGSLAFAALLALSPGFAHAAGEVTPDSGPLSGGTRINVTVPGGLNFVDVAVGYSHSLALGDDGQTYSWGTNQLGELGDNSFDDSNLPVAVHTPSGVKFTQIVSSSWTSLAVGNDKKAYAWGRTFLTSPSSSSDLHSSVPIEIPFPSGTEVKEVDNVYLASAALTGTGEIFTWGYNDFGQLGRTVVAATGFSGDPAPLENVSVAFTQMAAGYNHFLAIDTDGNVWGWGSNGQGELGPDVAAAQSQDPVKIGLPGGARATEVVGGRSTSFAFADDGNVYAWGSGYGPSPVLLQTPAGVGFVQLTAGDGFVIAIGDDGKTYGWGRNGDGQLGVGTNENTSTPTVVSSPDGTDFIRVVTNPGALHVLAISTNGDLWAWGPTTLGRSVTAQRSAATFPFEFEPV